MSSIKAQTIPEVSIFLPGSAYNIAALDQFEKNLEVKFYSAKWYQDWSGNFSADVANRFHNHGAVPELTWEPSINGEGISYAEVSGGKYDTYLDRFAGNVKTLDYPIRISLAPEMNGDWTPWAFDKNGNDNENFKSFWRHIVERFRANGANNIEWIWAPNIHYYNEKYSYSDIFPGNDYVTFLGLDGYNWGASQSWSGWQSFAEVFGHSYSSLTALSSKKILIMEIGCTETGGNKAEWISGMFNDIRTRFPQIQGITWFNENKETDWRIESSQSSRQAFLNGANGASVNSGPETAVISELVNNTTTSQLPTRRSSSTYSTPAIESPTSETTIIESLKTDTVIDQDHSDNIVIPQVLGVSDSATPKSAKNDLNKINTYLISALAIITFCYIFLRREKLLII